MTSTIGAGVAVRRAVEGDLAEILFLERETSTAPHWGAAEYRGMFAEGRGGVRRCLFVASAGRAGEAIAGFAVGKAVGEQPGVEAEIESVVVRAEARRLGLGTALCRAVMGWAVSEGAREVDLEVRAKSAGAVRLYTGLGFVGVGKRPGYYAGPADDAVVMRCVVGKTGGGGGGGELFPE